MEKTLAKMALYLHEHKPNWREAGQKSAYSIYDMLDHSQHLVFNIQASSSLGITDDESIDQAVEEEDLAVECWL
jgi:hypothetical protein